MKSLIRHTAILSLIVISTLLMPFLVFAEEDSYMKKRIKMIELIEDDVRETSSYLKKSDLNDDVLKALSTVPRHQFVPDDLDHKAYYNQPLPIGYGQTISQPYIVAIMTDLLEFKKNDKVLEIGTGSGYQAAILSELVKEVYSIEIIEPLYQQAKKRFKDLDYNNIILKSGDGYYGWESEAPFDAIIVTAAASHIPHPLIKQLKKGGRMIIPVGGQFMTQQLLLIEKSVDNKIQTRQILPVIFVPLTGNH